MNGYPSSASASRQADRPHYYQGKSALAQTAREWKQQVQMKGEEAMEKMKKTLHRDREYAQAPRYATNMDQIHKTEETEVRAARKPQELTRVEDEVYQLISPEEYKREIMRLNNLKLQPENGNGKSEANFHAEVEHVVRGVPNRSRNEQMSGTGRSSPLSEDSDSEEMREDDMTMEQLDVLKKTLRDIKNQVAEMADKLGSFVMETDEKMAARTRRDSKIKAPAPRVHDNYPSGDGLGQVDDDVYVWNGL